MKASELIKTMQNMIEENGDIDVVFQDGEWGDIDVSKVEVSKKSYISKDDLFCEGPEVIRLT